MTARKHKPGSLLGNLLGLVGFSVAAGALVAASLTPGVAVAAAAANSGIDMFQALPDYATINQQQDINIVYANRDGKPVEIARLYSQNRQSVELKQISPHAANATIAAEDRRYYSHGGVDAQSLARAVVSQFGIGTDSGASTLTMQLVRQQIIMDAFARAEEAAARDDVDEEAQQIIAEQRSDDSYNRKLREIKLAMALESAYTKDEIVLAYLNIANFGGTVYGIEAAAQEIFGISASRLNPAQSASLIATVKEPATLNLLNPDNFQANKERRDWILGQMMNQGYLTQEQYDENVAIPVNEDYVSYQPSRSGCVSGHESARFFCDYVEHVMKLDQVHGQHIFGQTREASAQALGQGGYKIYTTLDLDLNDAVQKHIRDIAPAEEDDWESGAAVTMLEVDTGRVLAMAQNQYYDPREDHADYSTGLNFNVTKPYGNSGGFQSGSAHKIFTLAEWVRQGYSVNEVLDTKRKPRVINVDGAPWTPFDPQNNAGIEWGRQSVTDIMVNSLNTGITEMATRLDVRDIQELAASMGMVNALDPSKPLSQMPSALIGGSNDNTAPISMAEAFATIGNDGVHCTPLAIDRIVDRDGNEVTPPQESCERVLTSEEASVMQHVLTQVNRGNASMTPGNAPVASKTGTNDKVVHTWVGGTSPRVAASVWVGNVKGEVSLEPYWHRVRHIFRLSMYDAINLYPGGQFVAPDAETLRGNTVELRDVSGMEVDEAISALESDGFENIEVGNPVEGANPEGTVEYTAPGSGTSVTPDSLITVYPSDGSQHESDDEDSDGESTGDGTRWPNLHGMSLSEARSAVTAAGFNADYVQVTWYPGSEDQRCRVLAQNPDANSGASPNDPISVVVGGRADGSAADC